MQLTLDDVFSNDNPLSTTSSLEQSPPVLAPLPRLPNPDDSKGVKMMKMLRREQEIDRHEATDLIPLNPKTKAKPLDQAGVIASITGAQYARVTVVDGKDPEGPPAEVSAAKEVDKPTREETIALLSKYARSILPKPVNKKTVASEAEDSDKAKNAKKTPKKKHRALTRKEYYKLQRCGDDSQEVPALPMFYEPQGLHILHPVLTGQPEMNASTEVAPHPDNMIAPTPPKAGAIGDHQVVLYGPAVGIFSTWYSEGTLDENLPRFQFKQWFDAYEYYSDNYEIDQTRIIKPYVPPGDKGNPYIIKSPTGDAEDPISVPPTPAIPKKRKDSPTQSPLRFKKAAKGTAAKPETSKVLVNAIRTGSPVPGPSRKGKECEDDFSISAITRTGRPRSVVSVSSKEEL